MVKVNQYIQYTQQYKNRKKGGTGNNHAANTKPGYIAVSNQCWEAGIKGKNRFASVTKNE